MRKELKDYIMKNIKEKYKHFDKAHNVQHYNYVTKNCVNYGKKLIEKGENIDLDIAYIVGAYHDIGIINGRENHALSSGKLVRVDAELKKYYDNNTIEIIAEAVEDHSSHLSYEPRSIYGKIVADADRSNSKYLIFSRPIKYRLKNVGCKSKNEIIDEVYEFVKNKYGRDGYVKYWLNIKETITEQNNIWNLLDDEESCRRYIEGLFDEITKGRF